MAEASASMTITDTEDAASTQGRKRNRNPAKWKVKHVKTPGLRKNALKIEMSDYTCCKKRV